jgi:hypothetical protein
MWSGSASSFVSLHPVGAEESVVQGMAAGEQVGELRTAGLSRAAMWHDTPQSVVDLHPRSALRSSANATDGARQVGSVFDGTSTHAVMWSGSADSMVNLTAGRPGYSYATDIAGHEQVGAHNGHPVLWRDTSASMIDLLPDWGGGGEAAAAVEGVQVGTVSEAGAQRYHAVVWFGSAASAVDLNAFLPENFWSASAVGVAVNGNRLEVGGHAWEYQGKSYNVIWSTIIPDPASKSLMIGALTASMCRRRRRGQDQSSPLIGSESQLSKTPAAQVGDSPLEGSAQSHTARTRSGLARRHP